MNITLDDSSPQIQYYSASYGWQTNHGGAHPDPELSNYYNGGFHGTYTDQDTMSFTFNGTAIYVYGAKRANHGYFSTQVDDGAVALVSGWASPDITQQLLLFAGGLSVGIEHTATLVNLPSRTYPPANVTKGILYWLDIDFIVITTAVTGKVYTTAYDDTSTAFQYSGFSFVPEPGYYNNTIHNSTNAGNSVTFPFNGSSVQILGGVSSVNGNYSAILDGGHAQVYNGTNFSPTALVNATLFTANNLTDGPHSISLTNLGGEGGPGGNVLSIDLAIVNSSYPPPTMQNTTGTNSTNTTIVNGDGGSDGVSTHSEDTGAIAGGIVGGVAALAIVGVLIWFFVFRKKRRNKDGKMFEPVDLNGTPNKEERDESVEGTAFQGGSHGINPRQNGYSSSTGHGTHNNTLDSYDELQPASSGSQPFSSGREITQTGLPALNVIPPPPSSNATSYPRTPTRDRGMFAARAASTADTDDSYERALDRMTGPSSIPTIEETHENPVRPPTSDLRPTKSLGVALPYTARSSGDIRTSTSLASSPPLQQQYNLPDRELDMGPVPMLDEEEQEHPEMLPPDYHQATQPLPGQSEGRTE